VLRLLFGAQTRDAGYVSVDGREVQTTSPADAIQAGFGYVPADRSREGLLPAQSIARNLSIVRVRKYWRHGWFRSRSELADARLAIAEYGVKARSPFDQMTQLSGGNQQKVVLARWIRLAPKVLLLDEPTQAVDVGARVELWQMVLRAAHDGTAVLVASDDIEELAYHCHRVVVVREGAPIAEVGHDELDPDTLNRILQTIEVA
jgi:ribose transport system ATP-binding protein